MKKPYYLVIMLSCLALTTVPCIASPNVLIRSPRADAPDFLAFIQTKGGMISYADYWLKTLKGQAPIPKLQRLISQAQEQFINGDLELAKAYFLEALQLRVEHHWSSAEKQALQYAALRLWQLTRDEVERKKFLALALANDEKIEDSSLYPSPLLIEFARLAKERRDSTLQLDLLFPAARYLVVDGEALSVTGGVVVKQDSLLHRFSLISDAFEPETWVGEWGDLSTRILKSAPLVRGDCQPQNSPSEVLQGLNAKIYWGSHCPTLISESQPANLQEKPNLKLAELRSESRPQVSPLPDLTNTKALDTKPKSWIKSKWLWIGAGSSLALLLLASQRDRARPEDKSTVGF